MDLYGRLRFGKTIFEGARRGFGCTLISGLKLQIGCLRALMEFAKNDLISYRVLLAQTIYQVLVLAVQPVVPSLIYRLTQPYYNQFLAIRLKNRLRAMGWQPDSSGRIDSRAP